MLKTISATAAVAALTLVSACSGAPQPDDSTTSPATVDFEQNISGPASGDPVTLTVADTAVGTSMRPDNIGISLEAIDLADERLDPEVSNLDDMLASLGTPGLRFGGNRLDRSLFWTSTGEAPEDEELTVVTPADLERLKRLVDVVGSEVTISVPLGDFDPERGADMAAHAHRILGDSLVGVSIGNEPNGYALPDKPDLRVRDDSWDPQEYEAQLQAYVDAIEEKDPDVPIIGPNVYSAQWMDPFLDADINGRRALAQHFYALSDCESTAVPGRGPEPENLISQDVHDNALFQLGIGMERAKAAHLPLWVEETGPTSCPGTNATSRTQASVLWATDYTLSIAQFGVERMNMHSMLGRCQGGAPMSPICDPARTNAPSDTFSPRVNFSGLRAAVPSVGGDFHEVTVDGERLRAYAVKKDERFVVTVVNIDDGADVAGRPLTIEVPDGYAATRAAQVTAASNDAVDETAVIPTAPLPDALPFSGERWTAEPTTEAAPEPTTGDSGETASAEPEAGPLELDIDSSSITVFIFEKTASTT